MSLRQLQRDCQRMWLVTGKPLGALSPIFPHTKPSRTTKCFTLPQLMCAAQSSLFFFPLPPYKLLKVTSPDMFLLVYLPRRHAARHSGKRGKTKKEWSETAWVNFATYVFFGAARKMSPRQSLLNNKFFSPTTLAGGDAKFAKMWIKCCE